MNIFDEAAHRCANRTWRDEFGVRLDELMEYARPVIDVEVGDWGSDKHCAWSQINANRRDPLNSHQLELVRLLFKKVIREWQSHREIELAHLFGAIRRFNRRLLLDAQSIDAAGAFAPPEAYLTTNPFNVAVTPSNMTIPPKCAPMTARIAGGALAAVASGHRILNVGIAAPDLPLPGPDGPISEGAVVELSLAPTTPEKITLILPTLAADERAALWTEVACLAYIECAAAVAQVFAENFDWHVDQIGGLEFAAELLCRQPEELAANLDSLLAPFVDDDDARTAVMLAAVHESALLLSDGNVCRNLEYLAGAISERRHPSDASDAWTKYFQGLGSGLPKSLNCLVSEATALSQLGEDGQLVAGHWGSVKMPRANYLH